MRLSLGLFCAGVLALAAAAGSAQAQRFSTENFGNGIVAVSVQYMIRLPLKSDDIDGQRDAMEQGRKLLYEMSSGECTLLLAAFASSCQLSNLSVQTSISRQREDNSATMSANAQYRVELKKKPDATSEPSTKPAP